MELRLVVQTPDSGRRDVVVDADATATGAALVDGLVRHLGLKDGKYEAHCERAESTLGSDELLHAAHLRHGDTLLLRARRAARSDPAAERTPFDFLVDRGLDAGTRRALRSGDYQIGRDPARCDIVLTDPKVSAAHLKLRVSADAISLSDLNSTNGTYVAGRRVRPSEWEVVDPSIEIRIGDSVVHIRPFGSRHGRAPDRSGVVAFNRPPRVVTGFTPPTIRIERPPDELRSARFPLAAILLPLAFAGGAAALLNQQSFLLFALLSPAMAAWSYLEERGSGRSQYRNAENDFRSQVAAAAKDLEAARAREVEWRNRATPGPMELVDRTKDHSSTTWERRPGDADFLHLRVGTADRPSSAQVRFEDGGSRSLRAEAERELTKKDLLRSVPIVIPMNSVSSVGLAGPRVEVTTIARWLLTQAASLHSPRDLAIAAVVAADRLDEWDWLKWLPHTSGDGSPLRGPHLAVSGESAAALMDNALAAIRGRLRERERSGTAGSASPYLLLVIDEAAGVDRAVASKILEAPLDVGVAAIWLGTDVHDLPGACRGVIEVAKAGRLAEAGVALDDDTVSWMSASHEETIEGITPDRLSRDDALTLARALAPLRDVSAESVAASVPRSISLVELLGIRDASEEYITARWHTPGDDVSAPIGRTATAQFDLDLRRDGPHGLIAGTTGSGKSELLQTMIASLAARHRPDRLTFLLVDYKGGAAFRDCVSLPHTLGIVTDLDEHLAERALISLNAELKRRERILEAAGAKDLTAMMKRDSARAPARLVILIDEFATLAREVPAFVDGVVDIAQRGRSLGVHLVLATQRPAGVVTPSIRANTNLRIALRVGDRSDSEDVIGSPEAAAIPRDLPGRAYARIGHDQLLEFQSAYSGSPASSDAAAAISIRDFAFGQADEPSKRSLTLAGEPTTELGRLVDVIARAAAQAGIEHQPAPWLPPLGELVPLDSVAVPAEEVSDARAVLGILDEPARQRQRPALFDLEADGSLLLYGTSGSGKTTLMRTVAVSLARLASPDALNIYGIDLATGGLKALEALPHCGSVIVGNDEERVVRLFAMLRAAVDARRRLLAETGVATIAELPSDKRASLPRLLILLNGYGAFVTAFERSAAEVVDALPRIVADGRALGIHFVIGADRRGVVPGSLAGVVPKRVILRMSDEDEYANLGLSRRHYAKGQLSAGRGFYEDGLELQCALVGTDPSGRGQADSIEAIAAELRQRFGESHVWRVELLPEKVNRGSLPTPTGALQAVIGIRDRDLAPATVSLRDGHFVIVGPYRSGRTTALETIIESITRASPDLELHLLAPRPSRLSTLGVWASAARNVDECRGMVASWSTGLPKSADASSEPSRCIVIDDGEELLDEDVADALGSIVRRGRDGGTRVLAAIERQAARRAFGGWFSEMRKDGRALILQPDLDIDGDLFGVRLPRTSGNLTLPGRGYVVERGQAEVVQVATTS